MIKKVLVIGIKGMAGHVVFRYLLKAGKYNIYGIARNIEPKMNIFNLDVANTQQLRELVEKECFDIVINCIGILNKDAEDHPAKAIWFNSYFPHFLEEITRGTKTKIIHISTDCVFSGKKGAYTESDPKDGLGFYAQSKALGELDNKKDLTLRTSIIGPELNKSGIGLFHWFMSQPEANALQGFSEAYWSGITTVELAKVIEEIVENQNLTGLLQVAPENKIDKYSLLKLFNSIYRNNSMIIIPDDSYKVDKSLISVRTDFNYKVPDYESMLLEMKNWIETQEGYIY